MVKLSRKLLSTRRRNILAGFGQLEAAAEPHAVSLLPGLMASVPDIMQFFMLLAILTLIQMETAKKYHVQPKMAIQSNSTI